MPISHITKSAFFGIFANVKGTPKWLLKLFCELCVTPKVESIFVKMSFVLVFPTEPVIAITLPSYFFREYFAIE